MEKQRQPVKDLRLKNYLNWTHYGKLLNRQLQVEFEGLVYRVTVVTEN